jgi:hypothetical protein
MTGRQHSGSIARCHERLYFIEKNRSQDEPAAERWIREERAGTTLNPTNGRVWNTLELQHLYIVKRSP